MKIPLNLILSAVLFQVFACEPLLAEDPKNTTETDKRSLRSGSFHSVPTVSRSAQRNSWTSPKTVRYNYGLRVIVTIAK
jgi:formylglycine-generating enzyme required for sulfatase activity